MQISLNENELENGNGNGDGDGNDRRLGQTHAIMEEYLSSGG